LDGNLQDLPFLVLVDVLVVVAAQLDLVDESLLDEVDGHGTPRRDNGNDGLFVAAAGKFGTWAIAEEGAPGSTGVVRADPGFKDREVQRFRKSTGAPRIALQEAAAVGVVSGRC